MRIMTLAVLALSCFLTGCKSEKMVMPSSTNKVDVSNVVGGGMGSMKPTSTTPGK